MKKIFYYIGIIALGLAAASCDDYNSAPVFDDANAFVEFGATSVSIAEDGGLISIPVTLASVKGIEENVSYAAVDGSAIEGKDFELVDGTATLKFDAQNRTQNIQVKILDRAGEYTGDLRFKIEIKSAGSVGVGMNSSCTVTITDNDHPLAAILGNYTVSGESYFDGAHQWTATFTKDPDDISVVHIKGLTYDLSDEVTGQVSEDQSTITIGLGQLFYTGSYKIKLYSFDGQYYYTESEMDSLVLKKDDTGAYVFNEYGPGFYVFDATTGEGLGFWDIFFPGVSFTKK